jgi:hypothetical protein
MGRGINSQLSHDFSPVRFHGAGANKQHFSDFLGRVSFGDQLKNLSVSVRQFLITLFLGRVLVD